MPDFKISDGVDSIYESPVQAITKAQTVTSASDSLGIKLPEEFRLPMFTTVPQAGALVVEKNPAAKIDHLHNAAIAVLRGESPVDHLQQNLIWGQLQALAAKMLDVRATAAADAINENADAITAQLREKVFEPTVDALLDLRAEHEGVKWDMGAALAAADYATAQLIKDHQTLTDRLNKAVQLRAMLYGSEAFTSDAAFITEPGEHPLPGIRPGDFSWWMQLLDEGRELHFPTAREWYEVDRDKGFAELREKAAEEENAELRQAAP